MGAAQQGPRRGQVGVARRGAHSCFLYAAAARHGGLGQASGGTQGIQNACGLSEWVGSYGEVRGCCVAGGLEWAGLRCRGMERLASAGRKTWLPAVG